MRLALLVVRVLAQDQHPRRVRVAQAERGEQVRQRRVYGPPLVLDPKQVEAARERIRMRYNVVREQNLQEQPGAKTPDLQTKL